MDTSRVPPDWAAEAVGPPRRHLSQPPGTAPLVRHTFDLGHADIREACLRVTAMGVYEVYLNGVRIGDHVLAPGWTSYRHRLRYQEFDVAALLRQGENVIGAVIADGWYRGRLGFRGGVDGLYGDQLALMAQLDASFSDESTTRIVSDASWRWSPGPVTRTGLYEGECFDARLEPCGWNAPGFDDDRWLPVEVVELVTSRLEPNTGPPVRRIESLTPTVLGKSSDGGVVLDFGQNMAGRLRIRVKGESGHTVTLLHAEVLQGGELARLPLRGAAQCDEYVLRGDEQGETWEPSFTIHGFRFAEVQNWPGRLDPTDIEAVVCHSDMRRTGWFSCSDPLLNRLHENIVWSMRSNFVGLPTDCPQRDERLGWTGDIQVFAPTAAYLYDCDEFLRSWLRDVAFEQAEYGTVPHYVPWVPLNFKLEPAAGWGDAAVVVPWVLYQRFGNDDVLKAQWDSMTAWTDQILGLVGDRHLWDNGFQFGDWLDPSAPPDRPDRGRTDRYLVATACLKNVLSIMTSVAVLLGNDRAHWHYREQGRRIRAAFDREYASPNGRLSSDSQTAYALALQFDLLTTQRQRDGAGARLGQLVADADYHIESGFLGTPLLADALTSAGRVDDAYCLLMQTTCPSWLYPVTQGATTVWERWDSMLPDGTLNPGDMTSFNHYALGAVADWMHRCIAGLAPDLPGYRRIRVHPRPGGGLTHVSARHETRFGSVAVEWRRREERFALDIRVPDDTSAVVILPEPGWKQITVGPGRHSFECAVRPAHADPVPDPAT